jgi:hypothetical protein
MRGKNQTTRVILNISYIFNNIQTMKTFQERREENLCNLLIAQDLGLKGGYFNSP